MMLRPLSLAFICLLLLSSSCFAKLIFSCDGGNQIYRWIVESDPSPSELYSNPLEAISVAAPNDAVIVLDDSYPTSPSVVDAPLV